MRIFVYYLHIVIFLLFIGCVQSNDNKKRIIKEKASDSIINLEEDNNSSRNSDIFNEQIYDTTISCNNENYKVVINKEPLKGKTYNGEFDNEISLLVIANNDTIYYKTFGKNYFGIKDENFMSRATLYNAGIDSLNCLEKNIYMFFFLCVPETDYGYEFQLVLDSVGDQEFFEIERDIEGELPPIRKKMRLLNDI